MIWLCIGAIGCVLVFVLWVLVKHGHAHAERTNTLACTAPDKDGRCWVYVMHKEPQK
jgi:hypothetical protein